MLQFKDLLASYVKEASDMVEKEKKSSPKGSKIPSGKAMAKSAPPSEPEQKSTESQHAEKVANALEYIVDHFDEIMPKSAIGRFGKLAGTVPGEGAGSLQVTKAIKPKADYAHQDHMVTTEDPAEVVKSPGPQGTIPTNSNKKPGGPLLKKEPYVNKPSIKHAALAKMISEKLAGEDVLKATGINSSGHGVGSMKKYDATQTAGTPPGHDQSGFGNENERHIMSIEAARKYTKRDAKMNYNKTQVGQSFDEVHPEKDTVLDRAFTHGRDTAKLAEIVEKGCTCDGSGSCDFCKKQEKMVKKIAFYKRAGAPGMDPAVAATAPAAGGQDPTIAAGGPPQMGMVPGCECGGQGQCLPCKKALLAAIMAKAQAGQPGASPAGGPGQANAPQTSPEQMI